MRWSDFFAGMTTASLLGVVVLIATGVWLKAWLCRRENCVALIVSFFKSLRLNGHRELLVRDAFGDLRAVPLERLEEAIEQLEPRADPSEPLQ